MSTSAATSEHCLQFGCEGDTLPGILSRPARPSPVGLVIVVGGPQYRVGSHRQFVQLARKVAAAGHAVLRFDYRGMGDADGAQRDFESVCADIEAAIAALRAAVPEVERVALWGLCDGASASLLMLDERPQTRLAGLCLLNPWVRSAQTQAAAQIKHYYARRLVDGAFWRKLLRGQVGLGRVVELAGSLRTLLNRRQAPSPPGQQLGYQQRMARAWHAATCPLLLVLSGNDLTAREFIEAVAADPAWRGALTHSRLTRVDLPEADHTFSASAAKAAVEQATIQWLAQLAASSQAQAASEVTQRAA